MTTAGIVTLLIDLSLIVAGGFAGWVLGRTENRSPTVADAHCGCGHPLALHDVDAGTCHGDVRRRHYDTIGNRNGFEWRRCRCVRYVGPRPIDDVLPNVYLPSEENQP